MNRKTIIAIAIILILAIMAYVLYGIAQQELENKSSAPYPLAQVQIVDTINPQPSQTLTNQSTKYNVSPDFTISDPKYDKLPMYEFSSSNTFSEDFATNLINKLGVDIVLNRQDPVFGKTIIAQRGTKAATIYLDHGELTYSDSSAQSEGAQSFVSSSDIESFKSKAQDFMNSLGLQNTNFKYQSAGYLEAGNEEADLTDRPTNANLIQLVYQTQIQDLDIIDRNSALIPNTIIVWLNSKGDIAKLNYESAGTVGKSFGNYQLLSASEVRQTLLQDSTKAKLVNGDYPIGSPIESVNIMQGHIAYLSVENYLVPVYILEANVRVSGGESGTGYLLFEAIKK